MLHIRRYLEEHGDEVKEESIRQSNTESLEPARETHRYECCGLKDREGCTLHPGSIYLYVKDGRW